MNILKFEDWFHELERHAATILSIKYEWVWYFFIGLILSLCMATQSLVVTHRSFIKVFDYA